MKSVLMTISATVLLSASVVFPSEAGSAFVQFNSGGFTIQIGHPPADDEFGDIEPADEGYGIDDGAVADEETDGVAAIDEPTLADPEIAGAVWALHIASCRIRYKTYRDSDNSYMSFEGFRKPCRSQWVY